jgi:proline dehydrogenase
MPGETLDDALTACHTLRQSGTGTILTHLGENLASAAEAGAVTEHYLEVIDRVAAARLSAQVSVKLTQLGLDLGADLCRANLARLVEKAEAVGNFVWIDMEGSPYVDVTLDVFRRARAGSERVGICLQAYLYRTAADLEVLLPLGPAVRVVKGAYREPPGLAFPRKRDVDENFLALCERLLATHGARVPAFLAAATHDVRLIERIQARAAERGVPAEAFEVQMLFGIQRAQQLRLAREGRRLRVLVSYGASWFPWYMRRLAERPANVLFVAKSLLTG